MCFRDIIDINPCSFSSKGCACWELGVRLVEDSIRLLIGFPTSAGGM